MKTLKKSWVKKYAKYFISDKPATDKTLYWNDPLHRMIIKGEKKKA